MLLLYVLSAIGGAAALYWLGPRAWYWHVIGGLAGLVAGLIPRPAAWNATGFYAATGAICVFLLVWSLGAIVAGIFAFRRERYERVPFRARRQAA